jgi:uncharacterized protein YcbK (DUF882 family)
MKLIEDFYTSEKQPFTYVGVVEENYDPKRRGRIKVRIQTLFHEIPLEDIPYAFPFAGLAGKDFQVPAIGKLVNVLFLTNNLYSPYYIYSENYNVNLQNKLKDLSKDDYVNFSAILFDETTQIYMEHETLTIDQLLNKITIDNDSINLELKDNIRKVYLGSRKGDNTQDAVLGTNYFKWMDKFIDELSDPSSLIGNHGSSILKQKLEMLCAEYKLKRPDFVSNNVKINDNGEVNILSRKPNTVSKKHDIDLIVPKETDGDFCGDGNVLKIQKDLDNTIKEQNKKSCKKLDKSAPVSVAQLPAKQTDPSLARTSEEASKVWDINSQAEINQLHPAFREYVTRFLNKAEAEDIEIIITSGYRSIEKQKELQKSGKAAKPGYSYHNYGLAIDIALKNSSNWDRVGKIGESLGLRWGKYFKNPQPERWHFDAGNWGLSTSELLSRINAGNVTSDGYINLLGTKVPGIGDYGQSYASSENKTEFNGQTYTSIDNKSDNCTSEDKFNRTDAKKTRKNSNNKSDETEKAASPDLEGLDNDPAKNEQTASNETDCKNYKKTNYSEIPITDKPNQNEMSFEYAVSYLKTNYDENTAKSVFAVMFAESSKDSTKQVFKSPGGYNYGGVQTDSGTWGYSNFTSQFPTKDAKGCRMFAGFQSNDAFLDFMANRLKSKDFDGSNKEEWTDSYLNNWVFKNLEGQNPNEFAKLKPQKEAIYSSAMKRYNLFA